MEKELKELLQNTGDNIIGVFQQMLRGGWVDDLGHDVQLNVAMLKMQDTLQDIMKFRRKYLDYTDAPSIDKP